MSRQQGEVRSRKTVQPLHQEEDDDDVRRHGVGQRAVFAAETLQLALHLLLHVLLLPAVFCVFFFLHLFFLFCLLATFSMFLDAHGAFREQVGKPRARKFRPTEPHRQDLSAGASATKRQRLQDAAAGV